jgi:acyl carrier protein
MSDRSAVEATVLDTLGEVLNESVRDLRAQPVLAAHDWDSIASLEALAQLESRLGVTLDLRAYHGARTVGDVVDLVAAAATAKTSAGRR